MRTEEIINKVFVRSFMGYDIEQVDLFLDEIIDALERYESEKREMLNAMEYLMRKLERGQKVPFADMKKAIDSGRPQTRRAEADAPAHAEEAKSAARSISRSGAAKPMRAPKVSRVKAEQDARDRIMQEAQAALPPLPQDEAEERAKSVAEAAASWLDELLINIAEHETSEHEKAQANPAGAQQEQTESKRDA